MIILLTQIQVIILDPEEPLKSSKQVFVVLCCVVLGRLEFSPKEIWKQMEWSLLWQGTTRQTQVL